MPNTAQINFLRERSRTTLTAHFIRTKFMTCRVNTLMDFILNAYVDGHPFASIRGRKNREHIMTHFNAHFSELITAHAEMAARNIEGCLARLRGPARAEYLRRENIQHYLTLANTSECAS